MNIPFDAQSYAALKLRVQEINTKLEITLDRNSNNDLDGLENFLDAVGSKMCKLTVQCFSENDCRFIGGKIGAVAPLLHTLDLRNIAYSTPPRGRRVRIRLLIDPLLASKNETVTNVMLPSRFDVTEEQTLLAPLLQVNRYRRTLEHSLMLAENERVNRLQRDLVDATTNYTDEQHIKLSLLFVMVHGNRDILHILKQSLRICKRSRFQFEVDELPNGKAREAATSLALEDDGGSDELTTARQQLDEERVAHEETKKQLAEMTAKYNLVTAKYNLVRQQTPQGHDAGHSGRL